MLLKKFSQCKKCGRCMGSFFDGSISSCRKIRTTKCRNMSGSDKHGVIHSVHEHSGKFHYFAFGSNLNTKRVHINGSTAKFVCIGKLLDYTLDFVAITPGSEQTSWYGGAATILQAKGKEVWGIVWELNQEEHAALDKQETGYEKIRVCIHGQDGQEYISDTYQAHSKTHMKPSTVYKHVIIYGAKEHNFPESYIKKLEEVEDNGYTGTVRVPGMEDANQFIDWSIVKSEDRDTH